MIAAIGYAAPEAVSNLGLPKPALVIWLRHVGCTFFGEALTQARELDQEFADLGVEVRFVVIGDRAKVDDFCGRFGDASKCIPDAATSSYAAMGLGDYDLSKLQTDPALQIRRSEANAAGFCLNREATVMSDATQLPGACIIDRDGIVKWIYRGVHPGDLPHVKEMLGTTRQLAGAI